MIPRQRSAELMDSPDASPIELARSLRFIERVNRWLGYTQATVGHLDRLIGDEPSAGKITILDVATGSADVPAAILGFADRRRTDVHVTALDLHETTLALARARAGPRLALVRADATRLPFEDRSFDFVISSMFLHHLDEDSAVRVLAETKRVARRGVIIADLLRSRRALFWISLFTTFSNTMVKHDARASVRQAFTALEMQDLLARAGLSGAQIHLHFGHRFVVVWQPATGG